VPFSQDWRWHDAAKHGDFSYGIYLYAFSIQQLTMLALGKPVSPLVLFVLALPPTLLAGVLSWHLIERRFLRKS
jgi:peptidoglycan/LPS O-acetylase OafA/YrhL